MLKIGNSGDSAVDDRSEKIMIETLICQNQHRMIIDWEGGYITDRPCINPATKYTVDQIGIFYLCQECYEDDCKRKLDSDLTLRKNVNDS